MLFIWNVDFNFIYLNVFLMISQKDYVRKTEYNGVANKGKCKFMTDDG